MNLSLSALTDDLDEVLITEEQLRRRVAELGERISRDYAGRQLVLVSVLKGGIIFLADLTRRVGIPHRLELVGASNYKGGTAPGPGVLITKDVDQPLRDRDVLLVEDVYDTGGTLHVVYDLMALHRPASLEVCALLFKRKTRPRELPIKYLGFEIEDRFVVGYGLDYRERYRNLPCIGVLKPEILRRLPSGAV